MCGKIAIYYNLMFVLVTPKLLFFFSVHMCISTQIYLFEQIRLFFLLSLFYDTK